MTERSDGKVERVLTRNLEPKSWSSSLARWARGRIDDATLRAATHSYAERVEADFYVAMRQRPKDPRAAQDLLHRVARNPLIDLMEVQLARDLLAPAFEATVPKKYPVP